MNPILIRSLRWAAAGLAGLVLVFVFALACTFVYLAPSLPTKETMPKLLQMSVPLRVLTRSGALVAMIGEERRIPVEFEEIPLVVRQAVLAAEDDRFFEHSGLDWMGVARAVFKTATGGSSQGGSTISQQAARNVYLSLDKTLRRKLAEIFVTWRMERDFSKEQILAIYLNKIFFGQRSYGIAAAAETYCGKRLKDISVAEAAMLAGIIQLPAIQNPIRSARNAEARRSYVLRRMTELGFIDAATAAAAAKEPIDSRGYAPIIDVEGGEYVAEMARQEVVKRFGETAVNAGYRVYTTLDARGQTAATRALRLGLMEYDRPRGYRGPLGKLDLPAATSDAELDQKLAKFSAVNMLQPAVVLRVEATSADVHVRGKGRARIAWEGMQWAARTVRNGVGPAPKKAADVFKRGDVVHVILDGRSNAQLAQLPKAQAALVALDPQDGAIVALAGGFDYTNNKFNRATQAKRQPMSGFKPFLYSAALENGYTPATTIYDGPVLVDDSVSEDRWRPGNSDGKWLGDISLRTALVRSRNTVSIRILQDIGINAFMQHAARFGFDPREMPHNQTLALGTLSVTPLRLAAGYAVFANGGFRIEPYFIERIEDSTGNVVYQAEPAIACAECETAATTPQKALDDHAALALAAETSKAGQADTTGIPAVTTAALEGPAAGELHPPEPAPAIALFGMDDIPAGLRDLASVQGGRGYLPEKRLAPRVLSAHNAWLMSDIMHDVTVSGTARRTRALGRDDLAGKTGTGDDGRDTWFNGFTRGLVATVWVGYDDNTSLGAGAEGANTAVPIWMHYMREALQATPQLRMARPAGLMDIRVLPSSGARADALDSCAVVETFMPEHLPRERRTSDAGCAAGAGESGTTRGNEPIF